MFDWSIAKKIVEYAAFDPKIMAIMSYDEDLHGLYSVIRDIAIVHEYSHYIQYSTTTFGLFYRILWEDISLEFFRDIRRLAEGEKSKILVRPLKKAEGKIREDFESSLIKYEYFNNYLGLLLLGRFLDGSLADQLEKKFSLLKIKLEGKEFKVLPGLRMIIEGLSTDIQNEYIDRKMGSDFHNKFEKFFIKQNIERYVNYYGLKSFLDAELNYESDELSYLQIRKLLDWSLMIPIDFETDKDVLTGAIGMPARLSPWFRLVTLLQYCLDRNGMKIPQDIDEFLQELLPSYWPSTQEIAERTLSYLDSEKCGISTYFRNIFRKAMEIRKKTQDFIIDPISISEEEMFKNELVENIGYPSQVKMPTNHFMPSIFANKNEKRFLYSSFWLREIYASIVEGVKKTCPFYALCDRKNPLCLVDYFRSQETNCQFAKVFEALTNYPFSSVKTLGIHD